MEKDISEEHSFRSNKAILANISIYDQNRIYNSVTIIWRFPTYTDLFWGFFVVVVVAVAVFDVLFFRVDVLDVAVAVADVIVNAELTDDVALAVAVAFAVATVHLLM